EELVHEPPAPVRFALDEREIFRREEHRSQDPQYVTGTDLLATVYPGAVRPALRDLELDRAGTVTAHDPRPDHRPLGAGPDERGVGRHPVRTERGDVTDGFDEVRLAAAVPPDEGVHTGFELEVGGRVRPEVEQGEVGDVHQQVIVRAPEVTPPSSPRGRRTADAGPRRPSSPATAPGGTRTARTAPRRSPAAARRGRCPRPPSTGPRRSRRPSRPASR